MTKLHAQPYDISANGFYFERPSEYAMSAINNKNDYGDIVEEYEIQFIDGELIDCELAKAWQLNQANFSEYFEAAEDWDDDDKIKYIIAVGEVGYSHSDYISGRNQIDITLYELSTMKELAEQFVDEGLFGEIPQHLENYIDYDAIARDLEMDYAQVAINGTDYIFLAT